MRDKLIPIDLPGLHAWTCFQHTDRPAAGVLRCGPAEVLYLPACTQCLAEVRQARLAQLATPPPQRTYPHVRSTSSVADSSAASPTLDTIPNRP